MFKICPSEMHNHVITHAHMRTCAYIIRSGMGNSLQTRCMSSAGTALFCQHLSAGVQSVDELWSLFGSMSFRMCVWF